MPRLGPNWIIITKKFLIYLFISHWLSVIGEKMGNSLTVQNTVSVCARVYHVLLCHHGCSKSVMGSIIEIINTHPMCILSVILMSQWKCQNEHPNTRWQIINISNYLLAVSPSPIQQQHSLFKYVIQMSDSVYYELYCLSFNVFISDV